MKLFILWSVNQIIQFQYRKYEFLSISWLSKHFLFRSYREARLAHDSSWFTDQLPGLRPYTRQLLRLVVVIKKKETNKVHVLLSEKTSWHLPTCEIHPMKSLHWTLRKFMVYLFGADVPEHRPHGLLSVSDTDKFVWSFLILLDLALQKNINAIFNTYG